MKHIVTDLEIKNVSGAVELTCIQKCDNCPMLTEDWNTLSQRALCAKNIWIPSRHTTKPGRDVIERINKPKALRNFLQELGLL